MRPSRPLSWTLLAALVFSGCDDSATTASGSAVGGAWDETKVVPILGRTDNGVILRYPDFVFGWCATEDSSGVLVPRLDLDTLSSQLDTLHLRLDGGEKLFVRAGSTDAGIDGRVFYWSEWLRASGTRTSFEGVWDYSFRGSVEVAYGEVPDSTLKRLQSMSQSSSSRYREAGTANQLEITPTSIISRYRAGEPAAIELINWDLQDKDNYALTVERVDGRTLRYKGESETVTLTFLDGGARRYTSTNPSRTAYTMVAEPRKISDCPEDPWFNSFMSSHYRFDGNF